MPETKEEIGKRLRKIRKKRGYTLKSLGKEVGVTYQTILRWEKGEAGIPSTKFPKLCNVLNIHHSALLEEEQILLKYPLVSKIKDNTHILSSENIDKKISIKELLPMGSEIVLLKAPDDETDSLGIVKNDWIMITTDFNKEELDLKKLYIFKIRDGKYKDKIFIRKINKTREGYAFNFSLLSGEIKTFPKKKIWLIGEIKKVIKNL